MIVSHKNRFVFLKTRKTAGTSIEIALSKYCGPGDIITGLSDSEEEMRLGLGYSGRQNTKIPLSMYRKWDLWHRLRGGGPAHHFNHTPAKLLRRRLDSEIFDEYYKFCVVRNPWDKAVSLYYWMKFGDEKGLPENHSFRDFLVSTSADLISNSSIYLVDREPAVDRFLRYENLNEELSDALNSLGLDSTDLPRTKAGTRKNRDHYSLMYDDESVALVAELCSWEIKRFGYEFEDMRELAASAP